MSETVGSHADGLAKFALSRTVAVVNDIDLNVPLCIICSVLKMILVKLHLSKL